jgi:hypothetical protein
MYVKQFREFQMPQVKVSLSSKSKLDVATFEPKTENRAGSAKSNYQKLQEGLGKGGGARAVVAAFMPKNKAKQEAPSPQTLAEVADVATKGYRESLDKKKVMEALGRVGDDLGVGLAALALGTAGLYGAKKMMGAVSRHSLNKASLTSSKVVEQVLSPVNKAAKHQPLTLGGQRSEWFSRQVFSSDPPPQNDLERIIIFKDTLHDATRHNFVIPDDVSTVRETALSVPSLKNPLGADASRTRGIKELERPILNPFHEYSYTVSDLREFRKKSMEMTRTNNDQGKNIAPVSEYETVLTKHAKQRGLNTEAIPSMAKKFQEADSWVLRRELTKLGRSIDTLPFGEGRAQGLLYTLRNVNKHNFEDYADNVKSQFRLQFPNKSRDFVQSRMKDSKPPDLATINSWYERAQSGRLIPAFDISRKSIFSGIENKANWYVRTNSNNSYENYARYVDKEIMRLWTRNNNINWGPSKKTLVEWYKKDMNSVARILEYNGKSPSIFSKENLDMFEYSKDNNIKDVSKMEEIIKEIEELKIPPIRAR